MRFRLIAIALLGLAAAPAGFGQSANPPPTRLRGEVAAVEGPQLVLAARDGGSQRVTLTDDTRYSRLVPAKLSAVKPGSFIGTTAVPGPDGNLKALEVHVFPEALRGTGEGHYDWDLAPGSTMTNANVDAAVTGRQGRELSLSYKGGTAKVVVPPDAPVVALEPGQRADLKPHAQVFVVAAKAPDGSLQALRIAVGSKGARPPM